MNFFSGIRKIIKPGSIYDQLKRLYFKLSPIGSKQYNLTSSFLRRFTKQFHLLNIYYRKFIKDFDTLSKDEIEHINRIIDRMPKKPLISVVMPVFNPDIRYFKDAIKSVRTQLYPYWELCIADDASTDPQVPALIKAYAQEDPRIKYILRKENGHISACSNTAISLATGEFIALLDHDDELHPLALYETANAINKNAGYKIIYSDEDKITKRGKRIDPYFKPDFDYNLFLSHNMVSHFGVYQTEIIRKIGGFRLGLEGSQDYDLVLRALEHTTKDQIHHIPRVLYHWRISEKSVAESLDVKPYAIFSGKNAIIDHLERRGISANVEILDKSVGYKIDYSIPHPYPAVELIIFKNGSLSKIESHLTEILKNTPYENFNVTVIIGENEGEENQSILEINQNCDRISLYKVRNNSDLISELNKLIQESSADLIGILDSNLGNFSPGWLKKLVSQAYQEDIGVVSPKIIDQDGLVYSNGIVLTPDEKIHHLFREKIDDEGYFGWGVLQKGYSVLSSKCMIFKKSQFISVGGFENAYNKLQSSTVDFCLKFKDAGFNNILCPSLKLYIQRDRSYNSGQGKIMDKTNLQDCELIQGKWGQYFRHDPCFNPNLNLTDDEKLIINLTPPLNSIGM
ncbi:MAG TPA: hypothetical protein DDX29_00600 [Clostridiales bacterium]|nr:hypothetical protein [Clostridiales bacterium]